MGFESLSVGSSKIDRIAFKFINDSFTKVVFLSDEPQNRCLSDELRFGSSLARLLNAAKIRSIKNNIISYFSFTKM